MELRRQWATPSELIGLPGLPGTHQGLNKLINRESLPTSPHRGRGGGREVDVTFFPEITQKHFVLKHYSNPIEGRLASFKKKKQSECESLWDLFERKPNKIKDEAKQRLQVVQTVYALMAQGEKKGAAKQLVANETGISARTIHRWIDIEEGPCNPSLTESLVPTMWLSNFWSTWVCRTNGTPWVRFFICSTSWIRRIGATGRRLRSSKNWRLAAMATDGNMTA